MESDFDKDVTALVIGDPHFKAKNMVEGEEFARRVIEEARNQQPTFIVILGDTLDTHEVVRVQPYKLVCTFIEYLSKIAPVYLLIGNHDLINASQFLTTNHPFNPLKKWNNVTVVDKPVYASYGLFGFMMCPYVPPGRFVEALDTFEDEEWRYVDCIFAHQEFKGCQMGAKTSIEGDEWDEDWAPVISGHIHDDQIVNNRIFYPGSAIQHTFGESHAKKIWLVTWGEEDWPYFKIKKISLGMKTKRIIHLDVKDIKEFDVSLAKKNHIKLNLKGTPEQFKIFRRDKKYSELEKLGVKFVYTTTGSLEDNVQSHQVPYTEMLRRVVKQKTEVVQQAYIDVVGETTFDDGSGDEDESSEYEIVFESLSESEPCEDVADDAGSGESELDSSGSSSSITPPTLEEEEKVPGHAKECPWSRYPTSPPANCGKTECIKYAHENGCVLGLDIAIHAAKTGQLKSLMYCHEVVGIPITLDILDAASDNHHDFCFKYAIESLEPDPEFVWRGKSVGDLKEIV